MQRKRGSQKFSIKGNVNWELAQSGRLSDSSVAKFLGRQHMARFLLLMQKVAFLEGAPADS